ncbi:PQQ-dependent sugar dehydrogenase [Chelativorans sp.]|uniref:PQQ-dependent sugar dehydrogenase n=1 Tax=Chelativorans sp. TaxID=2203393 RepID=UPI0035C76CBD
MPRLAVAALFATLLAAQAQAQTFEAEGIRLEAESLTDGLEHPWGIDFLPDGAAIVTERPGRMRIFADGELSEPLEGVPEVAAMGQGGLLDVVAARDFEQSGTVFFSYAEPGEGGAGTAIARARLVREDGAPRLEDVRTLFSLEPKTGRGQHFGSRIVEAPDGTLFFTIGDRGQSERAQDISDPAGSILRINPDGSVPQDNPFAGREDAAPQIWSIGHRNPQSAVWDPVTGALWTVEHGARGGDEVNRPEAGKNYGWPVIGYGRHYSGQRIGRGTEAPGYEQPEYYWDPSIAPSGMAVYQGSMFPEWEGDFLVGALSFELVSRLERDSAGEITGEERLFEGAFGRIRDVEVAPDGSVWLLTDEGNGQIIRISRAE